MNRGQKNMMDGISWIQVADGAMDEMSSIIQRIRELAVQGSNDTNTVADRAAIDDEIKQLRNEFNRISTTTQFNTIPVFDNSHMSMGVVGTINDMQIYNASYDDATGQVTWGGISIYDQRFDWKTIDPNMVAIDPVTHEQIFTGGEYDFVRPGAPIGKFHISTNAGDKVPTITRTLSVSANTIAQPGMSGLPGYTPGAIVIDDFEFPWRMLVDENGNPASEQNAHDGLWIMDLPDLHYTADHDPFLNPTGQLAFFVQSGVESLDDLADAINSCHDDIYKYTWKQETTGQRTEQAVDALVGQNMPVTKAYANNLGSAGDLSYTVRAGDGTSGTKDGIWLENSDGTEVSGSYKSWSMLESYNKYDLAHPDPILGGAMDLGGIDFWDSGWDIDCDRQYRYTDPTTKLSFDFLLSDITSKDSVIDGLDGMKISSNDAITHYQTELSITTGGNLLSATAVGSNNYVTFAEEKALGRDFDQQTFNLANKNVTYNAATHTADLDFNSVIQYSADTTGMENKLGSDLNRYLSDVTGQKQAAVLAGITNPTITGVDTGSYQLALETTDGRSIGMNYNYKYDDIANLVTVSMTADAAGAYVKEADGSYSAYDAAIHGSTTNRFNLTTTYKDVNGTTVPGLADAVNSYRDNAMGKMLNATNIGLKATDYTTLQTYGNENVNVAVRQLFDSYIDITPVENGIHIQNSSNVGDAIVLPRFSMNSVVTRLFAAGAKTYASAQKTIDIADHALEYVNKRRSLYGAYQNRLEHTYNNSANTEENSQAAESRIRDTDMAKEMVAFSKNNILAQAGQSMLAQANQGTQGILNLLQ